LLEGAFPIALLVIVFAWVDIAVTRDPEVIEKAGNGFAFMGSEYPL
jgi:hypothetical protein